MSAEQVKSAEQRALETNAGLLAQKVLEEGIEVPILNEARAQVEAAANTHPLDEDKDGHVDSIEAVFGVEDEAPKKGKGIYTSVTTTKVGLYAFAMGCMSPVAAAFIGKALLAAGYPLLTGAAFLGISAGVFFAPVAAYYIILAILALTTKSERVKKIVEGSKRAGNKSNTASQIKRDSKKK